MTPKPETPSETKTAPTPQPENQDPPGSEYRRFLDQLFGNKSEKLNILVYLLPLKKAKFFKTVDGACDYIKSINPSQQNIFFGCGLLRAGIKTDLKKTGGQGRGKKSDIAGIGGFWADIDFQSGDKPGYPTDIEAVKELIYGHGLDPTHVIFTGNGVHAWWMFKEPWEFDSPGEMAKAESLNNRLQETILKRAREKGWSMDKTHDLTRILRPPGTFNKKDPENPIATKILIEGPQQPYSDPEIFDDYLISEDEIKASKTIDQTEKVRIEDNLKLDPDANPPATLMQELFDIVPNFKASWNAQRPDLKKQSASEYALSLANYAAQAGWSDQDIANLIIAFYRRHRQNAAFEKKPDIKKALRVDYLSHTIALARAAAREQDIEDYYKNISPAVNTEYEKKLDPDGEKALARICDITGLSIRRIRQIKARFGSEYIMDVEYYSTTEGGMKCSEVSFKSVSEFSELKRFQDTVLHATTIFRPIQKKYWDKIVKPNLTKLIVVEEVGPQDVKAQLKDWFEDYLSGNEDRTVNDATLDKRPFVHKKCWHVHPENLNSWTFTMGVDKGDIDHTKQELVAAGCQFVERYSATNPNTETRTTVRGFFKVPPTLFKPRPPLKVIKGGAGNNAQPDENDTDTDTNDNDHDSEGYHYAGQ